MNTTLKEKKGKALSMYECVKIETLYKENYSISKIALILGRDKSTISREINRGLVAFRNSDWSERLEYSAYNSQIKRKEAKIKTGKKPLYVEQANLLEYIQAKLDNSYSPDAIAGGLKKNGISTISTQTIYNYVERGIFKYQHYNKIKNKNRKQKNKRLAYNNIKGRSIEERPFPSEDREFGHWEMDTVVSGRGGKSCLLVLTERASRFNWIVKLETRKQADVIKALDGLEKKYKDKFCNIFKSITVDNGVEFLNMAGIEKSIYGDNKRTTIYYAHPFASYERGSNENANKLIRKFIKKGDNIGKFSRKDIKYIQDWINNYPRKLFNHNSARDIFYSLC